MVFKRLNCLIIVFILALLLRVPSLFEPYWYGDENIYLVMGQALRKGLVFYKDIHDNKPPFLYLLASLSGTVFYFRLLLLIWSLASLYLFFEISRLIFKKRKIGFFLTLLFMIISTIPLFEGNIANSEIFMLLPTLGAVFLLLEKEEVSVENFFWAGILFSLAFLFKVPAGFDFAASFLFFLIFKEKDLKFFLRKSWWQKTLSFITGFLLPIVFSLFYYFTRGALLPYIRAGFFQNVGYLSSWKGKTGFLQGQERLLLRSGILLIMIFIFYLKRNHLEKNKQNFLFLPVWFLFSLFAALLSERPYPHYLIQVLPPLILLFGVFFEKKFKLIFVAFFCVLLFYFSLRYYRFYTYPVFGYYKNFFAYAIGKKSQRDYFNNFDGKTWQTYQVAEYLRTHTQKNDRTFIWGDEPGIQALSQRLPVGRFMVAYHIIHFNGFEETIKSLKDKMPGFVIKMTYEKPAFPQFDIFLNQFYLKVNQIGEAEIYHRIY